tara:strand:- start:218 stop:745 length:528 start_codon:yes stop_codon:yes gene_type:complete
MTLQPIYSQSTIKTRIAELAATLDNRFSDRPPPHIIGVLKGGFVFVSDLIRAMSLPVTVDFIRVSSYGANMRSSGSPHLLDVPTMELKSRDVVIVEDIVETGLTLRAIRASLLTQKPRSLTTVTLLAKPSQYQVNVSIDLVGFNIDTEYVVGYGLDADERYRDLPYLAILETPQS